MGLQSQHLGNGSWEFRGLGTLDMEVRHVMVEIQAWWLAYAYNLSTGARGLEKE